MRRWALSLTAVGAVLAGGGVARAAGPADVVTQHNDVQRSGTTFGETALSPSTVNAQSFGKLATLPIDSQVYAQPLYLHGVDIPDAGARNVLYVATVFNTLYAFDADTLDSTPLFRVSFGFSIPGTETHCPDLSPNVGITATPVIDAAAGIMYLETRTQDQVNGGAQHHTLHALDVRNGQDALTPVEIAATVSVPGQPDVAFDPKMENSRPGLLLANGNVYVAYGSLCDFGPYHGWIFSYSASTLEQESVFVTTPTGGSGGIWMGGGGLVSDSLGNVYASIGNGTMDLMDDGGANLSMAMARWSPDLQLTDWFSPINEALSSSKDLDLGPSPTLLLEDQGLLVGGGKEGILWVANSNDLGHQQANDTQIEKIVTPMGIATGWSGMASYPSSAGPELFVWGYGMPLTSYRYVGGSFSQLDASALSSPARKSGCPLSISVDDPDAGPGIVWALVASINNDFDSLAPGTLRAYRTDDLSTELWDSDMNAARDALGNVAKFTPPTIADGRVFAPTFSNLIDVYGLLPAVDGGQEDGGLGDGGEPPPDAGAGDAGDAGAIDAGPDAGPDAGDAGRDGGGVPDSGQGSTTTSSSSTGGNPPPPGGGGCSCTTGTDSWWWGLPLAVVCLRRRRRR